MDPIITVRGLSHFFGEGATRRQVLVDVSAEVMPGEIVIVTGPSGSGKTTLLTLVGGLRSIQHGSVATLGCALHGARADALVRLREQIGFIFQSHNLLQALTAEQNVEMALQVGRTPRGDMRRRALEMLAAVGLEEHAHSYPHQLSGGQRQRVAIARALARQPKMVLADEPTAALDKQAGREIVDLLHKLASERGCAIVLVTHDHRIVDVADRVLTLEDGRLTAGSTGLATHTELVLNALQRKGELQREAMSLARREFVELLSGFSSEVDQLTQTLDTARREVVDVLVDETVVTMTRKLRQTFHAERTTIYLLDDSGRTLRAKFGFHNGTQGMAVALPLGAGPAGRAAVAGRAQNLTARTGEPSLYAGIDGLQGFRAHAVVSAPIVAGDGRLIGVADLVNRVDGGSFSATEQRSFEELAIELGPILERCASQRATNR